MKTCKLNIVVSGLAVISLSLSEIIAQDANEAAAAVADDSEEMGKQLDATRDQIFKLFNEEKYQELVDTLCHEEIITLWHNGEITKGRQGLIDYFAKLRTFIDVMRVDPSTEHRAVYEGGKYVVSIGPLGDTYEIGGMGKFALKGKFALGSNWMATLVYEGGKWQLISFAASTNAFDNTIVEARMQGRGLKYGVYGIIVGFLISFIVVRIRRKK